MLKLYFKLSFLIFVKCEETSKTYRICDKLLLSVIGSIVSCMLCWSIHEEDVSTFGWHFRNVCMSYIQDPIFEQPTAGDRSAEEPGACLLLLLLGCRLHPATCCLLLLVESKFRVRVPRSVRFPFWFGHHDASAGTFLEFPRDVIPA